MPHRLPPEGAFVCIVEDEPDVARMIATILRDFSFETRHCRTAAELRQQLRQRVPDLCIIDLGLPDADGMELVQEIQRQHDDCGLLILTGRAWVGDRVMGLELGADDYVTKPFEPRELVARVRSILRRRGTHAENRRPHCARFAGWIFHPDTNTLCGPNGREWTLSTGEAKLLATFLQRPNRILAREQICGDPDLSPLDRSIDVRISRLRRKIEQDPQHPKLIRTVYGAGYLFASDVTWS